jgi:hypothetical protein
MAENIKAMSEPVQFIDYRERAYGAGEIEGRTFPAGTALTIAVRHPQGGVTRNYKVEPPAHQDAKSLTFGETIRLTVDLQGRYKSTVLQITKESTPK